MIPTYSFQGIQQVRLLETLFGIVPGVSTAEAVFYHDGGLRFFRQSETGNEEIFAPSEVRPELFRKIHVLREQKDAYTWLSSKETLIMSGDAWEDDSRDLFSENKNVVLMLRLHNSLDGRRDLYYLHFRENMSNFGISRADKALSTENKAIIGSLISNFLKVSRDRNVNDRGLSEIFNDHVFTLVSHNSHLKKEMERMQRKYSTLLLGHAMKKLDVISQNYGLTFTFTEEAMARIREFKGEQEIIDKVLEEAALFVYNIHEKDQPHQVRIDDWALNFEKYREVGSVSERLPEIDPREAKALDLLDKLEVSSQKVIEQELPLTSANVGAYCPTAITAPAITDALKKNRKKVIQVMKRYPERWPVIRNRFRPLRNLLQNYGQERNVAV